MTWPQNMPQPGEIVNVNGHHFEVLDRLFCDRVPYGKIHEGSNKGIPVILTGLLTGANEVHALYRGTK